MLDGGWVSEGRLFMDLVYVEQRWRVVVRATQGGTVCADYKGGLGLSALARLRVVHVKMEEDLSLDDMPNR